MPELPEVETIVRGLARRVVGDTINRSGSARGRSRSSRRPTSIATTLEGKRIVGVHRAGKHIVFELACDAEATTPRHAAEDAGATHSATASDAASARLPQLDARSGSSISA